MNFKNLSRCSTTLALALLCTTVLAEGPTDGGQWVRNSYDPYPFPYYVEDVDRYPATAPAAGAVNRHGEIEHLGAGVFGAHWFVQANGAVWHFVTAGQRTKPAVLLIHGYPDTWYAYHHVMAELADTYYVIAVDTLGYGQSDKRPEVDVSYAAVAASLIELLDTIEVDRFNLIAHDRGSVISDHLIATPGVSKRVLAFLRMQQSFAQPHGLPRPPHAQMATATWQAQDNLIRNVYNGNYVSVSLPEQELARLEWEFGFPGTAEAAARTFQGTSFDKELAFRLEHTIPKMTMPVLILQGDRDPGQHPEEYFNAAELLPDGHVMIVNTNHFMHAEDPQLVAGIARELFQHGNRRRKGDISSQPVSWRYPLKDL